MIQKFGKEVKYVGAKRTKAQQKRYLLKQQERRRKIRRTQSIIGNLRNIETEKRFFAAFNSVDLPHWFKSMRKADGKLIRRGVDAVAEVDCGKFYIQIKNSEHKALRFKNNPKHSGIDVIVTLKSDTPSIIRYQTLLILSDVRKKILEETTTA